MGILGMETMRMGNRDILFIKILRETKIEIEDFLLDLTLCMTASHSLLKRDGMKHSSMTIR